MKRNGLRFCSSAFLILVGWLPAFPLGGQTVNTNSLTPDADAYVQNGSNAGSNFGSANDLTVQTNSLARLNFDSYIRFSLTTVTNLSSAKLRIRARLSASGTVGTAFYMTATNWGESTITWNNKPARGAVLGSVNISGTTYGWYELNVTSFVLQEKAAGRSLVAFCLHNTTISSQDVEINSGEAAGANRPLLVCTTTNVLPTVALTQPANNATFTAPANISLGATAADSDGSIVQVGFYQGANLLGTDNTAPYTRNWNNIGVGTYTLTARARDNSGTESTSAPVNITVNAPASPPTVTITAPSNGALFNAPATVTISANASDADGTVTQVQFFDGTTLLNADTTAPYSYQWINVPAGSHSLKARATDNLGNSSTSGAVAITINLGPTVTLTSPASGTLLVSPANVTLSANASDADGTITKVEFYDGAALLNTDTTAPYSYLWSNVPGGNHSLTARAFDNRGVASTSGVATLSVNLRPTISLTAPANGAAFPLYSDVTLTAQAADADGTVSQVRFLVDGSSIGTDTASPYSALWSPPPGAHVLTAEVIDNLGATGVSSSVSVNILALDPDAGLTGYWKFDEGSGVVAGDSSGHGNAGTLSAAAWVEGKVGSYGLDVSSVAGMSVPNPGNLLLPPTGRPFSLSMWIKPMDLSSAQSGQTFLIGNASGQSGWQCGVAGSPTGLVFRFWSTENGGTLNLTTPAPLELNAWSILALTFNGDVATLYLNGTRLSSGNGNIVGNTAPLRLGLNGGSYPGLPVQVDDLRISNRELAPVEFGLTGHWSFDEGTGQVARDISGHDNHAGLLAPIWTPGRLGNGAIKFNGGYGWFGNVNNHALPDTGQPFSVSFWFSPESLAPGLGLLMAAEEAGVSGWRLGIRTAGLGTNEVWFWSTNSGGGLFVSGRSVLVPGQWYHLTVIYSGSAAKLYLDGQCLGSGSGAIIGNALPIVFAGGVSGVTGLPSQLDDLKTYNRELSLDELTLVGHWRFDESSGNSAGDSSGNGHHAQVSAGNWTAGRLGFGSLNLQTNPITVANPNCAVLPPTGRPFSLSLWLYPYALPLGYSGLLGSSSAQGNNGWKLAYYRDGAGTNAIRFWSVDNGGTLDLWAPAATLSVSTWNKLDVTFNGGIATIYINGRRVASDSGGILASTGDFKMGALPALPDFNGAIDEVRLFSRALEESEIGPVARVVWENVWMNTTTNITLPGFVPSGKTATYALFANATNGTAVVSAGGTVTYTPNPGYKGPDAFTYTVSDGDFITSPTVVALSIVQVRYLSPSGGSSPPLDGTRPEQAWIATPFTALDDIFRTNKNYVCFYYLPGAYETMGWKYGERTTASPGCKHIGSGREGPNATILKLVNLWHSRGEESIFGSQWYLPTPDGFEVRDMLLDCNAANNPKYAVGEPINIIAPLQGLQVVERIKLFWSTAPVPNGGFHYTSGHAQDYSIFAKNPANGQLNLIHTASGAPGGMADIPITPAVSTAEIQVRLTRRGEGVSFYSLQELEIFSGGNNIALGRPVTATNLFGSPSELEWDVTYSASRMVDGNYNTQWISAGQGMCGAIAVGGNNLKFINLKVIGFGTKAYRECFPVFIGLGNGLLPQDFGNVLMDNCLVSEPATNNTDGCSAIVMVRYPPSTVTNHVIRNSQVLNIKSTFDYSHGFSGTRVENCLARDVQTGVYFEPDPVVRDYGVSLIQSNLFVDVQNGINLAFQPNIQFSTVIAIGNEIVMGNDASLGFSTFDQGSSSVTNFTALNNVIRFNDRINQPGTARAFHSANIHNALFGNNIIVLGGSDDLRVGSGFDPLPLGYRRVWLNNRELSGNLLPVTYFNGSAIVPASQQQWP